MAVVGLVAVSLMVEAESDGLWSVCGCRCIGSGRGVWRRALLAAGETRSGIRQTTVAAEVVAAAVIVVVERAVRTTAVVEAATSSSAESAAAAASPSNGVDIRVILFLTLVFPLMGVDVLD